MLAQYNVDTLDPGTSLRRVKVLGERLRPGVLADPEHEMSWSHESYLLAQLIDEVAALSYLTARVNGAKPSRPKPFPRPGSQRKQPQRPTAKPQSSWAALADSLAGSGQKGVVVHSAG